VVDRYFLAAFSEIITGAFIPYSTEKNVLAEYLARPTPLYLTPNLYFLHQGVAGTEMGSGYIVNEIFEESMLPSHCTAAFSGHYHTFRKHSPRLYTVGSLTHQNWNDVNESKGFLIHDTDLDTTQRYEFSHPSEFKFLEDSFNNLSNLNSLINKVVRITDPDISSWGDMVQTLKDEGAIAVEMSPKSIVKSTILTSTLNPKTFDMQSVISKVLEKKGIKDTSTLEIGRMIQEEVDAI
jgi:DNA repair exonuclease SbcCD nuclease subunit